MPEVPPGLRQVEVELAHDPPPRDDAGDLLEEGGPPRR